MAGSTPAPRIPLPNAPPSSLEYLLHSAGRDVMALDLRNSVLRSPMMHRNIGLFPADLGFYRTVVPEGFHALLFVDSTTATQPSTMPAEDKP